MSASASGMERRIAMFVLLVLTLGQSPAVLSLRLSIDTVQGWIDIMDNNDVSLALHMELLDGMVKGMECGHGQEDSEGGEDRDRSPTEWPNPPPV